MRSRQRLRMSDDADTPVSETSAQQTPVADPLVEPFNTRLRNYNISGKPGRRRYTIRSLVSKKKRRFVDRADGVDLDLSYINDRIIAMGFPSVGLEAVYRNPAAQVRAFLEKRHPQRYRIWNLCVEKEYVADALGFKCDVERFCWADHTPPPLAMMRPACDSMLQWANAHPDNVIVVHCKAGKGRTGTIIAAYLVHARSCPDADSAMILFGERRTRNGRGVTIPSQMRFVRYWAQQRRAMGEAQAGWPDPLPAPKPVEVVAKHGQAEPQDGSVASSAPASTATTPAPDATPARSQTAGSTPTQSASTTPRTAQARLLWRVEDCDDPTARLLHVELHRDVARTAGISVASDAAGRLVIVKVAHKGKDGHNDVETDPAIGPASPLLSVSSILSVGDEVVAVGPLEATDGLGSASCPGRIGTWREGVQLLKAAPDPMLFTVVRWPDAGSRGGALGPPRSPAEYASRVARAVGPYAPGCDPRAVPSPSVQVLSVSLSHVSVVKASTVGEKARAACGSCLACMACGLLGACMSCGGPAKASSEYGQVIIQLFGGPLCRTLLFDSRAVDKGRTREMGVADWGARPVIVPMVRTSPVMSQPSPVAWSGQDKEAPSSSYASSSGSSSQSQDGPHGRQGNGKAKGKATDSGPLGPGPSWEATAAATLGRELSAGVWARGCSKTDRTAWTDLPGAAPCPLEEPAARFGSHYFEQLPQAEREASVYWSHIDLHAQHRLAQAAQAVSSKPRRVVLSGDFRLVIKAVGRKKPLATAWLHTAELPMPDAARHAFGRQVHAVQAAVAAGSKVKSEDEDEGDDAGSTPTAASGPSTPHSTPPSSPQPSRLSRIAGDSHGPVEELPVASSPVASPTDVMDVAVGLVSPTGTGARQAEDDEADSTDVPEDLAVPSLPALPLGVDPTLGGDVLAVHAQVGYPTLGAILTAAGDGTGASSARTSRGATTPSASMASAYTSRGKSSPPLSPELAQGLCEGSLVLVKRQLDGPAGIKDKRHKAWPAGMRLSLSYRLLDPPPMYLEAVQALQV